MNGDAISPFPYTFTDLYRVCLRINGLVPSFVLAGHRVVPRLVYTRECHPGKHFEVNQQEFYEINICLAGEALVTMGKEALVTPGTVVYTAPGTASVWRGGEQSCLVAYCWMSVEAPVQLPKPQRWPLWPWALHDLTLITEESRSNIHGWPERAGWRLATVLSRVLSRSPDLRKPEKPPSYAHDYLPVLVENYLAQHVAFPITLDDVAAHVQVSRRTLMREYRRRTGMTVMGKLLQLRMDAARFCLVQTSLPLADVAVQSGFPDTNYFCRVFRQHLGVPPLRYRRMMRG